MVAGDGGKAAHAQRKPGERVNAPPSLYIGINHNPASCAQRGERGMSQSFFPFFVPNAELRPAGGEGDVSRFFSPSRDEPGIAGQADI
jgi:hypothetical protein